MRQAASIENDFATSLRRARNFVGLSQEGFVPVSGRTYVSALELGIKSPTLGKVDELAQVLGVHPLTLLALAYMPNDSPSTVQGTFARVAAEVQEILKDRS